MRVDRTPDGNFAAVLPETEIRIALDEKRIEDAEAATPPG
jgi:hypothetical protein